jgi:hypothetical protein
MRASERKLKPKQRVPAKTTVRRRKTCGPAYVFAVDERAGGFAVGSAAQNMGWALTESRRLLAAERSRDHKLSPLFVLVASPQGASLTYVKTPRLISSGRAVGVALGRGIRRSAPANDRCALR